MHDFIIRAAGPDDVPLLMKFIRELADYENMSDQVCATEEVLSEWMFKRNGAEAVIGELNGEPVGFALFFHNFSTFLGRSGTYIEDLYVVPRERGRGFGKAFIKHIAGICVERGYGRLEWACLDWNTQSIGFYLSLGAEQMREWTVYRLTGSSLKALAEDQ